MTDDNDDMCSRNRATLERAISNFKVGMAAQGYSLHDNSCIPLADVLPVLRAAGRFAMSPRGHGGHISDEEAAALRDVEDEWGALAPETRARIEKP